MKRRRLYLETFWVKFLRTEIIRAESKYNQFLFYCCLTSIIYAASLRACVCFSIELCGLISLKSILGSPSSLLFYVFCCTDERCEGCEADPLPGPVAVAVQYYDIFVYSNIVVTMTPSPSQRPMFASAEHSCTSTIRSDASVSISSFDRISSVDIRLSARSILFIIII